jgi:steroid delta-isomerase-like uncharacterized protein
MATVRADPIAYLVASWRPGATPTLDHGLALWNLWQVSGRAAETRQIWVRLFWRSDFAPISDLRSPREPHRVSGLRSAGDQRNLPGLRSLNLPSTAALGGTFSSKNLGTTLLGGLEVYDTAPRVGAAAMTDTKLEQFARDSVDAFNRSDWDAIREMTCPGYVYEETGTGRRFDGVDDTLGALKEWKEAAPDATGEVVRVVTEGDTTVMEIVWRGTQTGPLNTGAGELPASGKAFEVQASMWQTWRGGKLADERHHLDVLTMLAQLGAIPASV